MGWVSRSKINHRILPLWYEKCCPKEIKNCTQSQALIPTLGTVTRPLNSPLAELQFLEFLCVCSSALVDTSGSVPYLYLLSRNLNKAETLAFSYLISSNQPGRNDNSVSSARHIFSVCAYFVAEKENCALCKWAQEERIYSLWHRELRRNIKQRLNLQKCHSFTVQMKLGRSLSKPIQDR